MKKLFFLFYLSAMCTIIAKAAPGDTTWVQAHYDKWLPTNGNYDTSVAFPSGTVSYRRIYMVFTLGKYQCPGNPQYCGDWDYMAQTYVMTPNGDTQELGRLITPYANASYPRTPWGWKQRYIFDVTDYYPILENNAIIRIRYSGSTGGFTANVKFAFIEGTPERNVTGVTALWRGDFAFGSSSNPIETKVAAITKTAPVGTQSAAMKFIVTGHRSDNTGCSEFCKKYYQVILNGNTVNQTDMWRDDCGYNHMYPQSGTWIYDRGNWCPGDLVYANTHVLTGVTGGSNYTIDVDFEPYTTTASVPPYYAVGASVIYYGGFNHTLDASLEDIISPSDYEGHFRENPVAGKPVIRVRNSGSTAITSLKFEYGLTGNPVQYTWSGLLAPLQEERIELPEPTGLRTATGSNNNFTAKILEVNSQADQDHLNNELSSVFTAAPVWSDKIVVRLKTNASSVGGVSETGWKILDPAGNVVAQRINNALNTQYSDTVSLTGNYYKLILIDEGCDGINWWANPNAGVGTLQVRPLTSLSPYVLKGYFNGDFGCGFTQYFSVDGPTVIRNVSTENIAGRMEVYPNPAQDHFTIFIEGVKDVDGKIEILDAMGRRVVEMNCHKNNNLLKTEHFANGLYQAVFYSNDGLKVQTTFMVNK